MGKSAGHFTLTVLDGYSFDAGHVADWRQRVGFVASIDDSGLDRGADAVLDSQLSALEDAYPSAQLRLLGPRYALLREEFVDPPARDPASGPPRLLVSLGGSATGDLLERLLGGLEAAELPLRARVWKQKPGTWKPEPGRCALRATL